MITWMQRNKKYLVVTIWISVIAFVGAGFVGWGAYDLNNNKATSVATVGHRNISVQEFQQKYNQIYEYHNNMSDGKLTQEKADELGIENEAFQAVLQENLLLNFADDIGLSVSDDDILKYIIADKNFQNDGVFSKNLYYDVLRRARINPNDYEKNLKTAILLDKLYYALNLPATKKDVEMMMASLFMQDKLSIEMIEANENEIKFNEDEIKELWESNKNNYMTKTLYTMDTLYVESKKDDINQTALNAYYNENKEKYKNSDDKIMPFDDVKEEVAKDYNIEQSKTNALEKYIAVKKGELSTNGSMSLNEDNATFSIDEIRGAKVGDVIKPFVYDNGYMIVKIKGITPPQPMSYDQAKKQILEIYKEQKLKELVENKAKTAMKDFHGKDIGFVSRDMNNTIDGLDRDETRTFIDQMFESPNKKGYVILGNKAVIYDILEQKLLTNSVNDNYKQLTEQNVMLLKNNELIKDLIKELQKRYEIKEYVKR